MKLSKTKLEAMAKAHYESLTGEVEWDKLLPFNRRVLLEAMEVALEALPGSEDISDIEADIHAALYETVNDGEGTLRPKDLVRNLERMGLKIVPFKEEDHHEDRQGSA